MPKFIIMRIHIFFPTCELYILCIHQSLISSELKLFYWSMIDIINLRLECLKPKLYRRRTKPVAKLYAARKAT